MADLTTIPFRLSSKRVIQLCDYLGKWLHLVSSSRHFLLPFAEQLSGRNCRVTILCFPSPGCFNFTQRIYPLPSRMELLLVSVNRTLTREPPPNFLVSQSSRSFFRDRRLTRKPASISPSETGRTSSKAVRPVKLLMQKLSSQPTGHSLASPGSSTSIWIFLANILITLSLHNHLGRVVIFACGPTRLSIAMSPCDCASM